MNIGIFAERIGTQGGGVETYELGLVKGLMDTDNKNQYRIFCSSVEGLSEMLKTHTNFTAKPVNPRSKLIRFSVGLPFEVHNENIDLLHVCMAPSLVSPKKYILTVHDLCTYIHPEYFPAKIRLRANFLLGKGIKNAVKIISVSETTKKDIIKFFKIEPEKISVIYSGVDKCYRPIKEKDKVNAVLKKYGIDDSYILYVGKLQARKNTKRLIDSFQIMKKKMGISQKLLLVGRKMWESQGVTDDIKNLGLQNDVIELGHIDYADLPHIYNGADLFVFPSLFEGFGLPPLEAMACGIPVVTSNVTSLPEVVGNAAITADPYKIEDIAEKCALAINDKTVRESLIEKGLARASLFTWENTARKTLEVYNEVYNSVNK